ncbi:MAG: methyl-accepting chemotaxis protein [Nitrospinae bacterium]|nr:methyl-accepting chemotaxis protein [Nitrospinota bacterium]
MALLQKMGIKYKLFMIGLVFSIPIVALLILLVNEKQIAINFAEKELHGSAYLRPVVKMLALASRHKILVAHPQGGEQAAESMRAAPTALSGLREQEGLRGAILGTGDKSGKIAREWEAAFAPVADQAFALQAHDELTADLRGLIASVGDSSNLILDPDLDSYYLMDAVLIKLPDMIDLTYQLSGLGADILHRQKLTPDEKTRLIILSSLLKSDLAGVKTDMEVAFRENPAGNVRPALKDRFQGYIAAVETFLREADRIANQAPDISADGFLASGEGTAHEIATFWSAADGEMDALLSMRIAGFQKRMATALVFSAVVVTIAYLLIYFILQSVANPILALGTQLREFTETLDLALRMRVGDKHEIGDLERMLNDHLETLSHIIGNVTTLADQVSASSSDIAATVGEQSAIFSEQSASLSMVTSSMEDLTRSSGRAAQSAATVADVANNALKKAEGGVAALDTLKEKMFEIQEDNRRGMREIMDLDAKSREIDKVMKVIADIAGQTKMIAFNAALEASASGEAGKRFAVVATEIRRLADNVMESAAEIDGKTSDIQRAVQRLVISSEKGTKTVDGGLSALAVTIDELGIIVAGAKSTTEAVAEISNATRLEQSATAQILTALKEIDSGICQASTAIAQTSQTSVEMKRMADGMKGLIGKFQHAAREV